MSTIFVSHQLIQMPTLQPISVSSFLSESIGHNNREQLLSPWRTNTSTYFAFSDSHVRFVKAGARQSSAIARAINFPSTCNRYNTNKLNWFTVALVAVCIQSRERLPHLHRVYPKTCPPGPPPTGGKLKERRKKGRGYFNDTRAFLILFLNQWDTTVNLKTTRAPKVTLLQASGLSEGNQGPAVSPQRKPIRLTSLPNPLPILSNERY